MELTSPSTSYHGPKLWNEIPLPIKSNDKLSIFKKQYKKNLAFGL